jgi:preprotein translocase subunit Sec63
MGFCLVAQPWTYKKIGGPSKLPKDFPWPIPNHSSPPWQLLYDRSLKPVFHFKRTVPYRNVYKKRIIFKFRNLVNVDWLILPQYAKKLTCDELFILIRG